MKKITAVLLTAVLAFSLAACNNDNGNNSADISAASETVSNANNSAENEVSNEDTLPQLELDPDPDLQKNFEEKIDMDKLGPLTKYAVNMLENKNMQVKFSIEPLEDDESSTETESSTSLDFSSIANNISVGIIKNSEKDYRITLDIGLFSFDVLRNREGIFSVNSNTKTYQVLKTAEEADKEEKEASENSGNEASAAIENLSGMTGGMLDGFNLDSMISDTDEKEVTYNGDGSEEYNGETYKFESYTVKSKQKQSSESSKESSTESKEETAEIKVYFGDDKIMKLIHVESDTAKADFIFDELSVTIDEDKLKIPEDYEVKETSEIDLSALGISIPDISVPEDN